MSGSVRIEPYDGADAAWDEAVAGLSGSTFCHLSGWRRVFDEALGHPSVFLAALDGDDSILGVLPMTRVKSRLFGDYLLSMPFLSYGGPLGPERVRGLLAQQAVREAEARGVDLLELRARTPVPGPLSTSDRKVTVLLDLPDTSEALWNEGLRSKLRSQIRRPMKAGMTSRIGLDLVDPFYEVFATTMRDLGTPVLPKSFFTRIASTFPDEALFAVVEREGAPVAAGCGFLWQGEFEITWAGALREHSRAAPNMLLYWSLMQASIDRGARVFNFGRCSPDSGTHRFKRQWGGRDAPLPWAQWSPTGVTATPNPDGAKYRIATRVWRRLPVGVTTRVGPWLARSLP